VVDHFKTAIQAGREEGVRFVWVSLTPVTTVRQLAGEGERLSKRISKGRSSVQGSLLGPIPVHSQTSM
jgi:hypothetical protein